MKGVHVVLLLMIALLAPGILMSQDAGVVYLEGWPSLRSGGASRDLDFGLLVRPGDSVLTGRRDYVELDQGGNSIRINSDTVFTLREIERDGRRETVMTNTVGSVAYRFQTLAGRRQEVGTATAVAGVRGTEFTVYAASDGSSLFAVDTGLVAVESAGVEVEVAAGQAVEVRAGEAPGDVYEWLGRELDFSDWNRQQMDAFLADPVAGARRVQERLRYFGNEAATLYAMWEDQVTRLEDARSDLTRIREEEGQDAFEKHRTDVINPLSRTATVLIFNTRYNALSALSLRRFVVPRMYTAMKTNYWQNLSDPVYREFFSVYEEILQEFEQVVVPRLVPADI